MENIGMVGSVLDSFFDESTMSVHFKENRPINMKKGTPGNWKSVKSDTISKEDLYALVDKIFSEVENRDDGFLEIDRSLSKVIQLGAYRTVIVYPPLSDGLEITVVRPIKKLSMKDYDLSQDVLDMLNNKSKGILVSGSPGSGKTTFAQALVELYQEKNSVIKTIESPRDLLVSDDVVQYSFTYGSHEEIRDILLLSRPDYTVYDEVRNTNDFQLYKDLRLTGIGLVGVIHATKPVDGIQRFLGNIELGIIPQIIDTVIYVDKGKISEILHLSLTVKVPEGMASDDLARPVVQVTSFFDNELKYEIYSFGEQIVVIPMGAIENPKENKISSYAKDAIQTKLLQILPCSFFVSVGNNSIDLYVPEEYKGRIIGKAGVNIVELEKRIGLSVNVKTFEDLPLSDVKVDVKYDKRDMWILFPRNYANKSVSLLIEDQVYNYRTDPNGGINIKKRNEINQINKKGFVVVDNDKL